MLTDYLEIIKGLEVIDTKDLGEGSFAILFDDGIIIYVGGPNGLVLAQGPGWQEMWDSL